MPLRFLLLLFTLSSYVLFFINTATTEIYTYGHSLSLHDSLPIYCIWPCRLACRQPMPGGWSLSASHRRARKPAMAISRSARSSKEPIMRSEEHTSEIQSLMRHSYTVFCLKTKKIENVIQKYDNY